MKILISIIFFSLGLFANEVRIAAASNVTYAIKPLIQAFNKQYPQTTVKHVIGSSGKLTAQINYGAPFDIFLSANMKYPNALFEAKIAVKKPAVYAKGSLALFSYKNRELRDLSLLNSVKRIAIANPKTAPYGKATFEALTNAQLYKDNQSKFIYAENISQTVQYAMTATDIGFIAKASLYSPKMKRFKENINYIDVDRNLYNPIEQGVALLNTKEASLQFYKFLFSVDAKELFKTYGYQVENNDK